MFYNICRDFNPQFCVLQYQLKIAKCRFTYKKCNLFEGVTSLWHQQQVSCLLILLCPPGFSPAMILMIEAWNHTFCQNEVGTAITWTVLFSFSTQSLCPSHLHTSCCFISYKILNSFFLSCPTLDCVEIMQCEIILHALSLKGFHLGYSSASSTSFCPKCRYCVRAQLCTFPYRGMYWTVCLCST